MPEVGSPDFLCFQEKKMKEQQVLPPSVFCLCLCLCLCLFKKRKNERAAGPPSLWPPLPPLRHTSHHWPARLLQKNTYLSNARKNMTKNMKKIMRKDMRRTSHRCWPVRLMQKKTRLSNAKSKNTFVSQMRVSPDKVVKRRLDTNRLRYLGKPSLNIARIANDVQRCS